jgi:dTDP-4-dehydrorhamnose reductase
LAQTRRADRILVVDNCSTDDTLEVLAGFAPEGVEVQSLRHNVGAAGGFHEAMRLGYETGADLVWVMDDDVIAAPDALAELMHAFEVLEAREVEAPFVVSCAQDPAGVLTNVPDVDHRRNALSYENWPHLLEHGLVPVSRSTFVSALFRRTTLERYGLPIAAMFIWGEDTEYTKRVTRDAPGYMVGRSHVEHVRAVPGVLDIRTESDPVRIGWHRLQIRNRMYTDRRYQGRREALRYAVRMGRLALSLLKSGQALKARTVIQGVLMGFTFNPDVQSVRVAPTPDALPLVEQASLPQEA